jgi:Zn-dependent protease with chaperone function
VDVQLRRRYDLIPNLVETVKGYAKHQRETFEKVTEARSKAINAGTVKEQGQAENMLTGALKSLFAVAWFFSELTDMGPYGLVLAAVIAIAMTFGSYYSSDKIVLAISRAKPVEKKDYPHLYNVVEGLAIAAGLPKPRCYIIG